MFQGYLIKFGNYTIPNKYINYNSYDATVNIQDVDSYRDANGLLHRNALEHQCISVNFSLLEGLEESVVSNIINNIKSNYSIIKERKVNVTAWIPEKCDYYTQEVYIADPTIKIQEIDNGKLIYGDVSFSVVGY